MKLDLSNNSLEGKCFRIRIVLLWTVLLVFAGRPGNLYQVGFIAIDLPGLRSVRPLCSDNRPA